MDNQLVLMLVGWFLQNRYVVERGHSSEPCIYIYIYIYFIHYTYRGGVLLSDKSPNVVVKVISAVALGGCRFATETAVLLKI